MTIIYLNEFLCEVLVFLLVCVECENCGSRRVGEEPVKRFQLRDDLGCEWAVRLPPCKRLQQSLLYRRRSFPGWNRIRCKARWEDRPPAAECWPPTRTWIRRYRWNKSWPNRNSPPLRALLVSATRLPIYYGERIFKFNAITSWKCVTTNYFGRTRCNSASVFFFSSTSWSVRSWTRPSKL